MANIYFRQNYDFIYTEIKNKPFYIFGNTTYAHIFYLYCKEKQCDGNISAFLVSDITRDRRRMHLDCEIPVRDLEWLEKTEVCCNIFLAAREKTVRTQLASLFQDFSDCNLYYVSDFTNTVMYSRYMYLYCEDMVRHCVISENVYDSNYINIAEPGSDNFYKYYRYRVNEGVRPDPTLFGKGRIIDDLYKKQLGNFMYLYNSDKLYKQDHIQDKKCKIYMVKSHFDKELVEEFDTPYTEVIQAGAALTERDLASKKDNMGDHISGRNKDYCEMTAIYWVWKNDRESDYIGFSHYRRRFVIDESILDQIMLEDYDAVYTIPKILDDGIRVEFVERNHFLTTEDWKVTGEAIDKISPEYTEEWKAFGSAYFLLSCNMFIMCRKTFEDYCSWVFPVLKEIDLHYLNQGIQCDNRYLGYIAECLVTVYVMKHKDQLKKGYVELKTLRSK